MNSATDHSEARATVPSAKRVKARNPFTIMMLLAVGAPVGCGNDPPATKDVIGDARPYALGTWALSYDAGATPPLIPAIEANTADTEALVVSFEHLGLPWDSFRGPSNTPAAPPTTWINAVDALIASARASGRTFILAISPLSLEVDTIAANAREDGGLLLVDTAFKPTCFDPSRETRPEDLRERFARYAAWLVNRARPDQAIIGRRLNIYEATCNSAAYSGMLGYVAAATRAVRALADEPVVETQGPFVVPTIIHGLDGEDLFGLPAKPGRCPGAGHEACLAARAPVIATFKAELAGAAAADIVGLEVYPAAWVVANCGDEIPARYIPLLVAALDVPQTAIIGTGLPAGTIQAREGPCVPWYVGDEDTQARWLDRVLSDAKDLGMPLVIWRSMRDLAPAAVVTSCPCAGDFDLCSHLSDLGARANTRRARLTEGLIANDGTERAAMGIWRAAFE